MGLPGFWVVLFILVLNVYCTSGVRIKLGGHDFYFENGVLSLLHRKGEPITRPDIAYNQQNSDVIGIRNHGIHPDLSHQSHDIHSSWDTPQHEEHGHNLDFEELLSNQDIGAYMQVEPLDLTKPKPHSNKDSVNIQEEPIDLRVSKPPSYPTAESVELSGGITHSFTKQQNEMVELFPTSGIMVDRVKLDKLVNAKKNSPRILMRRIFELVIPAKELARLQPTNRCGFKSIPQDVLEAIEAFVNNVAVPKISHRKFMTTLNNHLWYLRQAFAIKKEKSIYM